MRRIAAKVALAATLLTSLALNIYLLLPDRTFAERMSADQYGPYIEEAYRWKAAREHAPLATVKRLMVPSVVEFKDYTCVQLGNAPGVVGGRTVICFDQKTGKLSSVDEIGQ